MLVVWTYVSVTVYLVLTTPVGAQHAATDKESTGETSDNPFTVTMSSQENNILEVVSSTTQGSSVGAVLGIISGVVICLAAVVVVLAVVIRRKRQRDIEFERAQKVQRSSANTAGVYVDLATDTPIVKKNIAILESTEMDELKKGDDEDEEEIA